MLKSTIFEKIVFCSYVQKYQHFEINDGILRSLEKGVFWSYSILKNVNIWWKIKLFGDHFEKIIFAHIAENIKIQEKGAFL